MSERRKSGAPGAPDPHAARSAAPEAAPLDVARTLAGRALLVTGATGFVGKVALSMLLDRYPDVGRVFVLVRPGAGGTAEARFFDKVAPSRPFDPLRARHGAGFDAFLREKCVPVAGDVSDPLLGLSEADLARLDGLDAVVNSAGLVDFDASLELALAVNVRGPQHAVELCRRTGAALLHVSTCFVAGNRDGVVHEDEELLGYFPRREGVVGRPKEGTLDATDFSVESELADATRRIEELRARADDRVLQSGFRDRAVERLRAEGRAGDEKALRLAVGRERRLWLSEQLIDAGMTRARHWGWPNTYTYTKSLGEQAIAASDVVWSIVRPSIVESALRFPFPGWNEGFTTSAPLAFMALKGQRSFPAAEKAILDVVPVDLVAAAVIAATAELVERRDAARARPAATPAGRVYHLASGDVNPLWARRAVELTALYRRRFYREREEGNRTWNRLLSRLEPYSVSRGALRGREHARARRARARCAAAPAGGVAALGRAPALGARGRARGRARRAREPPREDEGALGPLPAVRLGQPLRLPVRGDPRAPGAALRRRPGPRAVGSGGARLAAVLARRPHEGHGGLGLPRARGGVREAGPRPEGPPRSRRAARCRLRALRGSRRAADAGRAQGTAHVRGAAPRRGCGRGVPARGRGREGRSRAAREREPAGVGRRLLRHPPRRRRGGPGRSPALRARAREPVAHRGRAARAPVRRRGGAEPRPRRARGRRGARRARGAARRGAREAGRRSSWAAREGRPGRSRLAHLHERHDGHAEGRHALAPELREPRREARRRSSSSAPATACSRCCRCTTRSSSPAGCSSRSRAARRSSTSTSSPPIASPRRSPPGASPR